MKKHILSLTLMTALLLFASSCIEEPDDFIPYKEGAQAVPSGIAGIFDLVDIPGSTVSFNVNVINSNAIQVSSVTIMKSYKGGAPVEHATITSWPASVSVTPADVVAGIPGAPAVSDLELGDFFTLSLIANTSNGPTRSPRTVRIDATCSSNLEGMYEAVTTYAVHDFLPTYSENTFTVEIKEVRSGVYSIADLSGGLYSEGPYVGAYGTSGIAAEFTDVCGNLTFSPVNDPWGPVDATISMDEQGVITVTATATAYGETWSSVYTPQ